MANCDILLLQEHWLYKYEQQIIQDLLPNVSYEARSTDEVNPRLLHHYRRGHAGVAVLWNTDLNHMVRVTDEGNERVQVCLLTDEAQDPVVILINVYMPAGNSKEELEEYSDTLDCINEILLDRHVPVFIIGDLNGSFNRACKSQRDKLLSKFCVEMHLHPIGDLDTPSYHHTNGVSTSRIDHILTGDRYKSLITSVSVNERHHLNVSTHDPLIIEANIKPYAPATGNAKSTTCKNVLTKIPWNKADTNQYKVETEGKLLAYAEVIDTETIPVDVQIERLMQIMYQSSLECIEARNNRKQPRKKTWDPRLKPYVKENMDAFAKWKASGQTKDPLNAVFIAMKRSKKQLRSVQRQIEAEKRKELHLQIMEADSRDKDLFYKIVNKQRASRAANSQYILFDGQMVEGPALLEKWQQYFKNLATPKNDPRYDKNHQKSVELQNLLRENVLLTNRSVVDTHTLEVSEEEVGSIIASLKKGKAQDSNGISAEHIMFASPLIIIHITNIINLIIRQQEIPDILKDGVITPIFKKKKSPLCPDNYRRITVTPIIGKILEKVIVKPTKQILRERLNTLQRGFCDNSSSINAALMVSEAIAEAQDNRQPLYTALLDASKAFDVVWHEGMLARIAELNIDGPLWLLYRSMYEKMYSSVKWGGKISNSFYDLQGVRQGGIPSTELFKGRGDHLLCALENSGLGYKVGPIDLSAPTCADDMVLITDNLIALQEMLTIAELDAERERFDYSTTKTAVVTFNSTLKCSALESCSWLKLNGETLQVSDKETHLGIQRTPDGKASESVKVNMQKANRTLYALQVIGMHGLNGLHPVSCVKLWNTYVLPVLIYGLEVLPLSKSDIESLERLQRKALKRIQHLPNETGNPAVSILTGTMPVKAILDQRRLTLFLSILRQPKSREYAIISRQLAIKEEKSKSWVTSVKRLLSDYDLPTAYELMESPPSKYLWKKQLKRSVFLYWSSSITNHAKDMSTLTHLTTRLTLGSVHPVWRYCGLNRTDIMMATIKVKMLVGRYYLQIDRAKFNGGPATCPLCSEDDENLEHLIMHCCKLQTVRQKYIPRIKELATTSNIRCMDSDLMFLILDPDRADIDMCEDNRRNLERVSRQYLYALHHLRTQQLK